MTFGVHESPVNSLKCPQGLMNTKVFPFLDSFFTVSSGWFVVYGAEQLS